MATGKEAAVASLEALGGALKTPFVGNVSQHVPLPPDHSGGAKKGRLQFDACFEGGPCMLAVISPAHLSTVSLPVCCRQPGPGGLHQ